MSEYEQRDIDQMEGLYLKHVEAMTDEGLHSKSAIAAELAWRDYLLECREQDCELMQKELKKRADELKRVRADLEELDNETRV